MRRDIAECSGKIEDLDRSFDLKFWQSQSDTARLRAAWELVVHSFIIKGKDISQLKLDRTVEHFGRRPR